MREPLEDPWAESANDYTVDSTLNETKENNTMTISAEEPFTVTLKRGGGFDDPWVVIRSSSAEEAKSRLQEAMTSGLFDVVNQAVSSFGNKPASQPAQPQQSYQKPAQAPSAPQDEPAWADGRTCGHQGPDGYVGHGRMKAKEGYNQEKQKAWKAYFCPLRKGDPNQCRAIWL